MMRVPPATDAAHAHQVVRGKAHQCLARQFGLANEFCLGQATHRLHPAKGLFDALAHFQAGLVAFVPLGAPVDGRVLVFGRDMRSDFESAAAFDKSLAVVAFVGPHGDLLALVVSASQHGQCRLAFGAAAGWRDFYVHDQTVSVLHQDVAHVAQPGLVTLGFLVQPCFGVSGAGVGVVAALFALEVHLWVAPLGRGAFVIFALEAFVRGPGVNQRAVHTEVFVAGELGPVGGVFDPLEEHAGQVFVEQALAVGAEGGVVPDLVLDVQADEPAVPSSSTSGIWTP
jgi:hypothetical protein